MEVVKEYTYEELLERGKNTPEPSRTLVIGGDVENWYNSLSQYTAQYMHTALLPVLREGEIQYVTDFTNEEWQGWHYMVRGMFSVLREVRDNSVKLEAYVGAAEMLLAMPSYVSALTNIESSNGKNKAAEIWNIPRNYNLISNVALFYLLYARHNRGDTRATTELNFLTDKMAPIVCRYLDMAVGGEARHTIKESAYFQEGMLKRLANCPEIEEHAYSNHTWLERGRVLFEAQGKSDYMGYIYTAVAGERVAMWNRWHELREKHGFDILAWAILSHFGCIRGSIGGPLWAKAGILVWKYLKQEISNIYFLDQAFSLQHNGGAIFNKMWKVDGLQELLQAAFLGKVDELPQYLSVPEHKEIYQRICYSGFSVVDRNQAQGRLMEYTNKVRDRESVALDTSLVLGLPAGATLDG